MLRKRSLTVFAVAFVVVLVGGVALAQVGSFDLGGPDGSDAPAIVAGHAFGVAEDTDEVAKPEIDDGAAEETSQKPDGPGPDAADKPADDGSKPDGDGAPLEDEPEAPPEDKPEADSTPPDFGIQFPEDGYHTDHEIQVFEGFVEPGATVARGKYQAAADGGAWRIELVLSPGENVVTLVATDAAGNQSQDTVTVYLEGSAEEPPKEDPGDVEFWAKQKFGSCSDAVPYDVFYGAATPGSTIYVASPYGSGSTVAGDKGNWDIKVEFAGAPVGEPFEVVVESSDGGRQVFTFTHTGEGSGEPDK